MEIAYQARIDPCSDKKLNQEASGKGADPCHNIKKM